MKKITPIKIGPLVETNPIFKGRTVIAEDGALQRANEGIARPHIIFSNQDILFKILIEGGKLQDFSFVCKKACEWTIKFWLWRDCPLKLFPLDLKNAAEKIKSLKIFDLDVEGKMTLKKILIRISELPHLFTNLKSLITTITDLTDFSVPNSIEFLEHFDYNKIIRCPTTGYVYPHNNDLNICNLANLKSITLPFVIRFRDLKIQGLQNLQSIIIGEQPFENVNISCKECPNLTSITVNGEEIIFDKTSEVIMIEGKGISLDVINNALALCNDIADPLQDIAHRHLQNVENDHTSFSDSYDGEY